MKIELCILYFPEKTKVVYYSYISYRNTCGGTELVWASVHKYNYICIYFCLYLHAFFSFHFHTVSAYSHMHILPTFAYILVVKCLCWSCDSVVDLNITMFSHPFRTTALLSILFVCLNVCLCQVPNNIYTAFHEVTNIRTNRMEVIPSFKIRLCYCNLVTI